MRYVRERVPLKLYFQRNPPHVERRALIVPRTHPRSPSGVIISIRGGGSDSTFIELVFTSRRLSIYVAVERAMKH